MKSILFSSLFLFATSGLMAASPSGPLLVTDPPWFEEPPENNTFDMTDLTEVVVKNDMDGLILEIAFQSAWPGMQLHVLIETDFDTLGAVADPFEQPVQYVHELRPDYVLTSKYSTNDYGDFRRWNASVLQWEFWNPITGQWIDVWEATMTLDGNIQHHWVSREAEWVIIHIPWAPLGQTPDSLMVEVYLTQDDGVWKRSAFDSVPSDSTLDLDFDYENPQPGDWETALGPVELASWSPVYQVVTVFPATPLVKEVDIDPVVVQGGDFFHLIAEVIDGGDGVGQVSVDLSGIGGGKNQFLYDDGHPSSGDRWEGDGVFSLISQVPFELYPGNYPLEVRAYGTDLVLYSSRICTIAVEPGPPILTVEDALSDDHGPNQFGTQGMYYTYPLNEVFVPGAFDLTGLTIYETFADIGGEMVEMIAFQVGIVDFPDPRDPGTADWNPLYADLNVQKIDILIDSAPGGATATLPWRQAAFQAWDAWDYAIVIAGWYKALIPSLGQNNPDSWRANAFTADRDILLLSDPVADTVTALVSKSVLGDPTAEDILAWDIAVCMAGKDSGGEEVLGGIRWVNANASEWQFGGGDLGDHDSNYIDLLLVPGQGNQPGLSQEDILDYESPEALDRVAHGMTAVAIEMSRGGISGDIPAGEIEPFLAQNTPNPFNPQTTIVFDMPSQTAVSLAVYDVSGRLVDVLVDNEIAAQGRNEVVWRGRDSGGRIVPAGVYFYRLEAGGYTETKRMTLIR